MVRTDVLSFVVVIAVGGGPATPSPLRPQSDRLRGVVDVASRDSATFLSVVEALADRDVLVLIVDGPCDLRRREACLVHQVVTSGRYRFLRVQVRDDIAYPRIAGVIAHELWHALEAARADVTDADSFARFFAAHGHACEQQHIQTCYETDEAVAVQDRVMRELRATARAASPGARR
jgi:hypothetical protein